MDDENNTFIRHALYIAGASRLTLYINFMTFRLRCWKITAAIKLIVATIHYVVKHSAV